MRLPPLFATGLWLAATAGSTVMVWTATSIVAADVTDRAPKVVAQEEVVSQLESAPVITAAPPSTTKPSGPATPVPTSARGPVPAGQSAPQQTATSSRGPQPGATVAPSSPPTTKPATVATPTTRAPNPTTTQAPRPSATYSTSGGVVRVACSGFFIELLSAIPNNGYSVRVLAAGPGNVDVRFTRSGQEQSVKAVCYGRPIRYYESPPNQTPGSP